MVKAWRILLAGWIMVVPLLVQAGVIRLTPQAHIELVEGAPVAIIQFTNPGDEPYKILSVDARLQGLTSKAFPGKSLIPGEQAEVKLSFPALPFRFDGQPAVIRTHYAHDNGTTFSSLVLASPPEGQSNETPWVLTRLAPASIGRTGQLFLQMTLLQDEPSEVNVRLILPDELSCKFQERKLLLEPDSQRVETFELTNHGAVPGGTYTVYVSVERTSNGVVRYATEPGTITVVEIKWIGQSYGFWGGLSITLVIGLMLWIFLQRKQGHTVAAPGGLFDAAILTAISLFVGWQLSPFDVFLNTTPVGGDTPAHLYLVSHLKEQLFQHGRVISWAGGWWCGFPMYQYYFALPYIAAASLSLIIPLNIAFKCVSVAGLVFTPLCAYWAAREWYLPGAGSILLAVAMVPFLFVQSHTMWGVNTASTLAGMIANSWSFALMLPALALGMRDISEEKIRGRTIVLFVLVLASHFFTSVIMFVSLAVLPIVMVLNAGVQGRRLTRLGRGALVVGGEFALAVMIMGWWLIPLIAKSKFSMDFGANWDLSLVRSFPAYATGALVFAGVALVVGIRRPLPVVWLFAWMGVVSVGLFEFGYCLSPVFVNVRLWPFIFFALMALAAVGGGILFEKIIRWRVVVGLLVPAILIAVAMSDSVGGLYGPGLTQSWAKWNFSGLESKPSASVFKKWMPLLKGSPGRLANDLCEENNQLGSSRVFELVPYLIGKPILEGGLVNSALGSMYAYYVQGETSPSCAGFPPIVTPTTFDFSRATKHLELFNVKQFIARSSIAKQALQSMKEWRFIGREDEWTLYELMSHEGRYVFIPPRLPGVVETSRWKECSLEWLYTPQALDQFLLWKMPGMTIDHPELATFKEGWALKVLEEMRHTNSVGASLAGRLLPQAGTQCISDEFVSDSRIQFRTTALGLPHIIKMTWFPNWKVRGARQVYCISPGFMCVFPERSEVELYYGTTWSDVVGYVITTLGCCVFGVLILWKRKKKEFF